MESRHFRIIESNSFEDLIHYRKKKSIFFLDLDNTLVRPSDAKDVCSDQFFYSLYNYANDVLDDKNKAKLICISIVNHLQRIIDIKPVDLDNSKVIKMLTHKGHLVIGLTARDISTSKSTNFQLHEIGVQLSSPKLMNSNHIKLNISESRRNVQYQRGIIYCDGADKGICMEAFLKIANVDIDSILVVDDSQINLEKIAKSSANLNLPFIGLRYNKMDSRVLSFKPELSVIKLKDWQRLGLLPSPVESSLNLLKSAEKEKEVRSIMSLL